MPVNLFRKASVVFFVWLCFTSAAAQNSTTEKGARPTRRLSLSECIQIALEHNREIQIEKINPRIVRLTLDASYGAYDPRLVLSAEREYRREPGGFDPADLSEYEAHDAQNHAVNVGLEGLLPTGASYTLEGDYAHTYGQRLGIDYDAYRVVANISITQPLLRDFWTDQTRTTVKINRKNIRISELGVQFVLMEVIHRIELAYYELIFARENLQVQRKLLDVRKAFQQEAHQKVLAGAIPAIEEKLAEAQVASAEIALIEAQNAVTIAENELRTLLGDDFRSSDGVEWIPADPLLVLPQELDLQASWQRGLERRPDLAQLRVELEKQELDLKFRRNQLFPWLDLVAGYGRRGSSTFERRVPLQPSASGAKAFDQIWDGSAPSDLIGVIFTMPLSRTTERANYRASKELREQALLRLKQREELVLREISDALATARSNRERIEAARRAAELAEAALRAEEQKLAAGQSTFYVVLQLQGDLASARSEEIRAKADYNKSLSTLYRAEGSLLERHKIDIQYK
ncbi:MAG: TolC family protein [Verrucomicrobiae bacterium]|nr:TolC family protein [Verrucomicrobiae bacterium]